MRGGVDTGDGTIKALQNFVKRSIAPYKYPRAIVFVDDLPKTETWIGKGAHPSETVRSLIDRARRAQAQAETQVQA